MRWPAAPSAHREADDAVAAAADTGTIEVSSFMAKLPSHQTKRATSPTPYSTFEQDREDSSERRERSVKDKNKKSSSSSSWRDHMFPYKLADLIRNESSEVSSTEESVDHREDELMGTRNQGDDELSPPLGQSVFLDKYLWRNDKYRPYCDWELQVVRKPSGKIDTYKVHKLIVGVGRGKSLLLAEDIRREDASNGKQLTQVELEEGLADFVPEVLDWIYHPFVEDNKNLTKSFVNMMILAEYLEIPSLRDKLKQQYMRREVTVEDLADMWGSLVESRKEAQRLVATLTDSIATYVSQKVVDTINKGSDSQVEQLVDDLAPVADQDLILRVMSSNEFTGTEITKKRTGKHGYNQASVRLSRFVARFCKTHDTLPPQQSKDSTYVCGSSVAKGLMEQLVDLWTKQYGSMYDHAATEYDKLHKQIARSSAMRYNSVQEHVSELYQQHSRMLDMALNGKLCESFRTDGLCRSSGSLPSWFKVMGFRGQRRSDDSDPPDIEKKASKYSL